MENILAIEAAIGGGSIAILSDDRILGTWNGTEAAGRSEQLLGIINELLEKTGVERGDLTRLAVSNGPGSYTGIRIGLATAMGLSCALDIPLAGISALRAIALSQTEKELLVVVPLGRSGYCWQFFSDADGVPGIIGPAETGSIGDLLERILNEPQAAVAAAAESYGSITSDPRILCRPGSVLNAGFDLAVAVGIATGSVDEGLSPYYAREAYVSRSLST